MLWLVQCRVLQETKQRQFEGIVRDAMIKKVEQEVSSVKLAAIKAESDPEENRRRPLKAVGSDPLRRSL